MIKIARRAVCGLGTVALTCLSACTTIETHQRVADWPNLKVIEHHVSNPEMRDRCVPYAGPWSSPMGCTLYFLDQREAHIYVSKDFPSATVLEHERLHAAGYDHVGSDDMSVMLKNWRARHRVAVQE